MALSALVKISGVNNLSDARFCAGMGAGIIGFCPEPGNADFVDLKKFREITQWLQGVKLAGEFYNSTVEYLIQADREYHFDYLQINQPDFIGALKDSGKPIIFNIDLSTYKNWEGVTTKIRPLSTSVEFILIQGRIPPNIRFEEICGSSNDFRIMLGTGITKENLPGLITQYSFAGFALKGSGEIKPGYLEPGELGDMMELLESDV